MRTKIGAKDAAARPGPGLGRLTHPRRAAIRRRRATEDAARHPRAPMLVSRRLRSCGDAQGRPLAISWYASPVAVAYTAWWKASIAISSLGQKIAGGATSSAGRVTCAAP
jgi:hypothetical protein